MANCWWRTIPWGLAVLARMVRCAISSSFSSTSSLRSLDSWVRGRPFCGCRVRSHQATTADPQSIAAAVTESAFFRSPCCRAVCSSDSSPRLIRSAIVLKPSTLLSLHQALRNRKYQLLFSPKQRRKPGPKGPSRELIEAVVQTKQRNPTWGCPRIAQQIALAFNIPIDKDIVRRILASHYRPEQGSTGPSWLTFIGHFK